MQKKHLLTRSAFSVLLMASVAAPVSAQLKDEVIVTATKRTETLSDVPIAVAALGEDTLEELNVNVFTDYLQQLPGVSAGGSGPGQSTIYIRGVASTTPQLSIAGVAGLAPNVAFYLDEQPLAQPGRNLDVYAADLERVEVLSGPQGTLFGASSQAGTVRLITNKPKLGVTEAAVKGGVSFTKGGEMSYNMEAMINAPMGDRFAVRGVVYHDNQGGYIDNVPGVLDASQSARFRPAGTVRSNGVPVASFRGGFQGTQDISGVNFISANNGALVENNFNDTKYQGIRLSARAELNDDWSLDVGYGHQELDSDGVFFYDPNLGTDDYNIQRYEDEFLADDFDNINWTLNGRLGALEAVYTGAFTDRDTNQRIDYTDYLFVGQYLPYYICEGSVTYPSFYSGTPAGTCYAPNSAVPSVSNTEVMTHEFRINTPSEKRWRATLGAFYSDLTLEERNDFQYFGGDNPGTAFGATAVDNFAQPSNDNFITRGAFPQSTVFRNDIQRTDEQFGIFGEATYDLSDQFAITVGARYYDIEVDLKGSANATFCNSSGVDENAFGTHISDLYDGDGSYTFIGSCNDAQRQTYDLQDTQAQIEASQLAAGATAAQAAARAVQIYNAVRAPDVAKAEGVIMKITGTYTPNDDLLFYGTYSQGFRPGLLNRPGGAFQAATNFTVPFELETDDVDNFELGWKTTLADNQVRFNGSAFYIDISNLQTTIFDTSIVNLFFSDNAADARVLGVEGDFQYAPETIPGLTLNGAFSILDTEITEVITPTGDVVKGDELAFAPSFQGNLRARYEWDTEYNMLAHIMPSITYSAASNSDILRQNTDRVQGYTSVGLAAGVSRDNWMAEIYASNLFNDRGEISRYYGNDRERVTPLRPQTIGARFAVKY